MKQTFWEKWREGNLALQPFPWHKLVLLSGTKSGTKFDLPVEDRKAVRALRSTTHLLTSLHTLSRHLPNHQCPLAWTQISSKTPGLDFQKNIQETNSLLYSVGRKMENEVGGNDHNCRNYALGKVVNTICLQLSRSHECTDCESWLKNKIWKDSKVLRQQCCINLDSISVQ